MIELDMSPSLPAVDGVDRRVVNAVPCCKITLLHLATKGADDGDIGFPQLGPAARLSRHSDAPSALVIDGVGHGLDVRGVHAGAVWATRPTKAPRAVMAEMVAFQAIGDRADQRFEGPAVDPSLLTAVPEFSVALSIASPR